MRTNIVLDNALVEEARQLTGIKTKKDLVDEALRTLIRLRRQNEAWRFTRSITLGRRSR